MRPEQEALAGSAYRVLETDEMVVIVVPDEGGRISSLRSKATDLEFLTQSSRSKQLVSPAMDRLFHEGACAGAEECLPSVAPCGPETEGGAVPDHGDFWQLAWRITKPSTSLRLCMEATGFSRSLRFRKELQVEGRELQVRYSVENIGPRQVSFLYAHHPLFAVAAGDRIMLTIDHLALNYSLGHRLGPSGAMLDWPISHLQEDIDLSLVQPASAHTAEMLYTERLKNGRCGIWRMSHQQAVWLTWNPEELPFLGVWLCYGGWPNVIGFQQQYAVALEPTLAPCGDLAAAQQRRMAKVIAPGDRFHWNIGYELSKPGLPLTQCNPPWR